MKKNILNFILLMGAVLFISSCHKTYACKCTTPDGASTFTTGQVKALSKKKAEERCSGSCQGGTVSVK